MRLLERLGHEVVFPEEQTCCGQLHANSGYQLEAVPLARRFVRVFGEHDAIVTPSGSCAAMVRDGYPRLAELAQDDRLAGEVAAVGPRVHELSELLGRRPRRRGRRRVLPAPRDLPPDLPRAAPAEGRRPPAAPPARRVKGIDLVELPDAETCCGFGGTFAVKNADTSAAMLTDKMRAVLDTRAEICTALDNSCLLHIGGGLSRARAGTRAVHLAEILAATEGRVSDRGFPAAAREALANTQQRRNLGHATRTIRAKRAGVVGEVPDWEALRDAGAAIKASAMARLHELLEQLEASVTAAGGQVHWARDGAEANAILTRHRARRTAPTEVVKVKSLATDEIEMNEALAAEGITAQETDLAELIVQLGDDEQSHILVPAIHRNRAEIRELFRRTLDGAEDLERRARGARRGRPAPPARAASSSARVGVSGANFAVARDRHDLRRRVRGQRADVHDAARRPRDRHGDREGRARVRGPRGHAPAAAALLDRRADEPVHVAVDRHRRDGDGPQEFHLDPARRRAHRRPGRPARARRAALHPLLGLPERLPRLRAHGRPRLRVRLPRPDRRDPHAAARRAARGPHAALGLVALRRVLRGLPGEDRHPLHARPPARAHRARRRRARRRARGSAASASRWRRSPAPSAAGAATRPRRRPAGRGSGRSPAAPARIEHGPRARCTRGRRSATCAPVPGEAFRDWWRTRVDHDALRARTSWAASAPRWAAEPAA